jgi:hypothetical protein
LPILGLQETHKGCETSPQALATQIKRTRTTKETMMLNEIKIVEDGVIFELEIEEVEEVVAPAVVVTAG